MTYRTDHVGGLVRPETGCSPRRSREYMADWKVGDVYPATPLCRRMINGQISPMSVSVDSQDIFDDLSKYKERASSRTS